jgi:hypothetical protein
MTTKSPTNHHYVSQCHLKEFFDSDSKRIYLYDKIEKNYYNRQGIKRIFSLDNLNNRVIGDVVDRISMEMELRFMFEENFTKHLAFIKKLLVDLSVVEEAYEHLNFIALMALVGEYRNPNYKEGLDIALKSLATEVKIRGVNIPDEYPLPDIPYRNIKGYLHVGNLLLTEMDPINFSIVVIESNDHFILPDTSGFLVREFLEYGKVTQFGIPVSSKIFILGKSAKIKAPPSRIITIQDDDDELVFKINTDLVNFAYKTVACQNKAYLENTVSKMMRIRFLGQHFHGYSL